MPGGKQSLRGPQVVSGAGSVVWADYREVMLRRTRRTLEHLTPDLGPYDQWLTERAAEGWVPEYPWDPPEVTVNGHQVRAVALIDVDSGHRSHW